MDVPCSCPGRPGEDKRRITHKRATRRWIGHIYTSGSLPAGEIAFLQVESRPSSVMLSRDGAVATVIRRTLFDRQLASTILLGARTYPRPMTRRGGADVGRFIAL